MLGAILANPGEDGPRLVFADWLSERGDPRGSFIAIQCELAQGSARGQDLAAEEEALLSAHGRQWLKGLPDDVVHVHFRRGFAESAEVRDASALAELEGFFQSEPVTELSFVSPQALDAERFATLQWLDRLRSLEFRVPRPNAPGALSLARLTHLLDSRRLGKLSRLALVGQRLGDEGLALLAVQGGKALTGLECLIVEDDVITDHGVAPFADSKWGARLKELSLANNELRVDGAAALAESRSPGRLTWLSLGGNQLGNAGASVIAGSRRFGSLSSLSLPRNRIGAAGLDALLESKMLAGLTTLDLTGNPIGTAGRKRLRARFG